MSTIAPTIPPTIPPKIPPKIKVPRMGFLLNQDNSCYMDSVLTAVLFNANRNLRTFLMRELSGKPTRFLQAQVLNHMRWINRPEKYDRPNLNDLKYAIYLNKPERPFFRHYQEDAAEFLIWLTGRLGFNSLVRQTSNYVTNLVRPSALELFQSDSPRLHLNSSSEDRTASPLIYIPLDRLTGPSRISRHLLTIEDSGCLGAEDRVRGDGDRADRLYRRRIEISRLVHPPFFFALLNRVGIRYKNTTPVTPDFQVKLQDQTYRLQSLVVHQGGYSGGHYVAYIRYKADWFCYDDMNSRLIPIGDYKVLKRIPEVVCCTTIAYYVHVV